MRLEHEAIERLEAVRLDRLRDIRARLEAGTLTPERAAVLETLANHGLDEDDEDLLMYMPPVLPDGVGALEELPLPGPEAQPLRATAGEGWPGRRPSPPRGSGTDGGRAVGHGTGADTERATFAAACCPCSSSSTAAALGLDLPVARTPPRGTTTSPAAGEAMGPTRNNSPATSAWARFQVPEIPMFRPRPPVGDGGAPNSGSSGNNAARSSAGDSPALPQTASSTVTGSAASQSTTVIAAAATISLAPQAAVPATSKLPSLASPPPPPSSVSQPPLSPAPSTVTSSPLSLSTTTTTASAANPTTTAAANPAVGNTLPPMSIPTVTETVVASYSDIDDTEATTSPPAPEAVEPGAGGQEPAVGGSTRGDGSADDDDSANLSPASMNALLAEVAVRVRAGTIDLASLVCTAPLGCECGCSDAGLGIQATGILLDKQTTAVGLHIPFLHAVPSIPAARDH